MLDVCVCVFVCCLWFVNYYTAVAYDLSKVDGRAYCQSIKYSYYNMVFIFQTHNSYNVMYSTFARLYWISKLCFSFLLLYFGVECVMFSMMLMMMHYCVFMTTTSSNKKVRRDDSLKKIWKNVQNFKWGERSSLSLFYYFNLSFIIQCFCGK